MSETDLIEALLLKKPYFGSALRALQGNAERHKYMPCIVNFVRKQTQCDTVNILEIGSWAGASAVTWAKALEQYKLQGEVMCIDPWEPFIDLEKNRDRHYLEMERSLKTGAIFKLFLHNIETCGVSDRVKFIKGKSENHLQSLEKNSFSVIYIDGAHHYEGVLHDLRESAKLVSEGGVICGDDLELQMLQLNELNLDNDVKKNADYTQEKDSGIFYHPGVTKAVGEMFGEVSEWEGFWAIQKKQGQWVQPEISLENLCIPSHLISFLTGSGDESFALDAYNVLRYQDKLVAISKNIGTIDPAERVGNCDIFPLVFSSNSMDELNAKIENAESSIMGAHLELVEQTDYYNYIKMGKRLFAVSTSLGPVELKAPIGTMDFPPYIIQGESSEEVREKVRHYIAQKKVHNECHS